MSGDGTVLAEEEVLELFAYLLTSARTQLDDPAGYGSMRLLTAAEFVRDTVAERVSPALGAMLEATRDTTLFAQAHTNDVAAYTAALDEVCERVAQHLVDRDARDRGVGS